MEGEDGVRGDGKRGWRERMEREVREVRENDIHGAVTLFRTTLELASDLLSVFDEEQESRPEEEVKGEHEEREADKVSGEPRVSLWVQAHEACQTL